MKRVAFTIILNGLHHLQHNDYAEYLAKNLDLWVIVEGAAKNQGSTAWCKEMPDEWHKDGHSIDGTRAYLIKFMTKYDPFVFCWLNSYGFWPSKDKMVNSAITTIVNDVKFQMGSYFLWQIDADEQWTIEQMAEAEQMLLDQGGKTGMFHCNYYVGKNLMAKGEWGEGLKLPYRRLWLWDGEPFATHEPPVLDGGNGKEVLLPQRFNHYAYYFEQDVRFKDAWYGGHEGIYQQWLELQDETVFPQPISRLITGPWGKTKTEIVRI